MLNGVFIVFEGIRSEQKLTQAVKLKEWLGSLGYDVVLTHEPTSGKLGKLARKYLNEGKPMLTAIMYAADRLEHAEKVINTALNQGKVVINDTYYYTSFAYQSSMGADIKWVRQLNAFAPKPDLAILIDFDVEKSMKDAKAENKLKKFYANMELQKKFKQKMMEFVKTRELVLVNGNRTPERVELDVRRLVSNLLGI